MSMDKLDNVVSNYKTQNVWMEWKNLQSWLNDFKNLDQDQRDKIDKIKLVRINNIWSAILVYCT